MKTKHIVITAAIIGLVFLLLKKVKGKAEEAASAFKLEDWFGRNEYKVTHPALGSFNITAPLSSAQGQYHRLATNADLELGWQKVLPAEFVVTLLHKTGSIYSEAYVVNTDTQKATYHSELNPVTIVG